MQYSKAYSRWLQLMALVAAIGVVASLTMFDQTAAKGALFLVVCIVLAKVIPIETSDGTELSLSAALDITAALVLGWVAALACATGAFLAVVAQKGRAFAPYHWISGESTWSRDVIAITAAGHLARHLKFSGITSRESFGHALMCAGLYMLINQVINIVSASLRYNVSPLTASAMTPPRIIGWWVLQVALGLFGLYAYSLVPLTPLTLIGFAVFAMLVIYAARLYIDMRSTYWGTIFALIPAIESEFDHNVGHARRVSAYSLAIARKLGLREDEAIAIYIGGMLHDVGMVGVDDQIVNKPSSLSMEEYGVVRRHADLGAGILEKVPLLRPAFLVVKHHHERWDGSGYPDALSDQTIPLGARIVAAADVFDALVSKRPHRGPLTVTEALAVMQKDAGVKYDPEVVGALHLVIGDEMRWGKGVLIQHHSLDFAG